jgi:hypothetical protein
MTDSPKSGRSLLSLILIVFGGLLFLQRGPLKRYLTIERM